MDVEIKVMRLLTAIIIFLFLMAISSSRLHSFYFWTGFHWGNICFYFTFLNFNFLDGKVFEKEKQNIFFLFIVDINCCLKENNEKENQ